MSTLVEPVVRDEVLDAALAWANEFRSCEQLPKGSRGSTFSCPLALATGLAVDTDEAYSFIGEKFDLPPLVAEFVNRFDSGDFSHLNVDQPVG